MIFSIRNGKTDLQYIILFLLQRKIIFETLRDKQMLPEVIVIKSSGQRCIVGQDKQTNAFRKMSHYKIKARPTMNVMKLLRV